MGIPKVTRCKRCVMPDTRPDSHFVDGVCSACIEYDRREQIDWDARRKELESILSEAKKVGAPYDAVVPVSGGKDSTYQTITLLEMGARVLCVHAMTDLPSDTGLQNLGNLCNYADVISWAPKIKARQRLVRAGLEIIGDMSYPEHLAIWAIPTRIAVSMKIPLVIWGEQPQREYAAPEAMPIPQRLNAAWVEEFGGLLGLRLDDLVGYEGLTEHDLEPYRFPSDADMEASGTRGFWLGEFLPWDGWKNAFIAQQFGFKTRELPVEQSLANYENLDNHVTVLRDWLRYEKYGYGRATDIASNHIRRGRLTRDEALKLIERAEVFPKTSLGMPIEDVLAYFDLTVDEFKEYCAQWRNDEIFQ